MMDGLTRRLPALVFWGANGLDLALSSTQLGDVAVLEPEDKSPNRQIATRKHHQRRFRLPGDPAHCTSSRVFCSTVSALCTFFLGNNF